MRIFYRLIPDRLKKTLNKPLKCVLSHREMM